MEAGLDSLALVELRNDLSLAFGLDLSATVMFNYPTISTLANYITEELHHKQRETERHEPAPLIHTAPPHSNSGIAEIEQAVQELVKALVGADVLQSQPLMEAGLDSLSAVDLRSSLETHFGISVPATAIFDYPTITALSSYIASTMNAGSQHSAIPEPDSASAARRAVLPEHVFTSIAGTSGRFPATADSLDSFWQGSINAVDLPESVPLHRWELDSLYAPHQTSSTMYVRFAAFVCNIDMFDGQVCHC